MQITETFKDIPYQTFALLFDVIISEGGKYPKIQRAAELIDNSVKDLAEPEKTVICSLYGLEGRKSTTVDKIAQSMHMSVQDVIAIQRKVFSDFNTKINI